MGALEDLRLTAAKGPCTLFLYTANGLSRNEPRRLQTLNYPAIGLKAKIPVSCPTIHAKDEFTELLYTPTGLSSTCVPLYEIPYPSLGLYSCRLNAAAHYYNASSPHMRHLLAIGCRSVQ